MNKKTLIGLVVILFIVILLLVRANKQSNTDQEIAVSPDETEIPCLPNGHQKIASHIHPTLTIFIDGDEETIPANLGIEGSCMREVHTHDTTGSIHIETAKLGSTYTLADFFTVWGEEHDRQGYVLEITQDGEVKESVEDVILSDHSVIQMSYVSE